MNALIVLNYNDAETTLSFLESARKLKEIQKIIVVDNHSTDDSYDKLKAAEVESIEVIQTKRNGGYAYGNNYGAFYALEKYDPEYLLIANPDVILSDTLIDSIQEVFEKKPKAGIVTGRMHCTSSIRLPIAWKRPKYRDCILENFIILKRLVGERNLYPENYFKENVVEVESLPGSFFIISGKVFREINGFDEGTFLYYEENMLSYRLNEKGYKNYLITNQEYIHNHSVSINKSIDSVKKRLEISERSREIYCRDYLKIGKLKLFLLKITFMIGTFDYIFASRIFHRR